MVPCMIGTIPFVVLEEKNRGRLYISPEEFKLLGHPDTKKMIDDFFNSRRSSDEPATIDVIPDIEIKFTREGRRSTAIFSKYVMAQAYFHFVRTPQIQLIRSEWKCLSEKFEEVLKLLEILDEINKKFHVN